MTIIVVKRDGSRENFDFAKIERLNEFATKGLNIDKDLLKSQIKLLIYDGMSTREIFQTQIRAASGLISLENPDFTFVAARYLLADTYKLAAADGKMRHLKDVITQGVNEGLYNPLMATKFNLEELNAALNYERDYQFDYLGLQTVVDRYLMRDTNGRLLELPQHFFMRVAMGLCLKEGKATQRAIDLYNILSQFDGMPSTPTLFNSGTLHSQMSSCYVNTVNDQISADVEGGENRYSSIFGTIEECARLSKFAGGIGTDWTRVRGSGSHIKSTNGKSSGVIPYLKVYNDTAVGVNQGGRRKGSFAPYLEPWHPDFWDFCQLKKEFGDEHLRTHDIFPASWIPDLLFERVIERGMWSEFCPHTYPELHDLYGDAFKARVLELEQQGLYQKQRPAIDVWRHIITHLFETGHPWVTFKDEMNRRNPQDHVGVIHSSNLCTEIALNTSDEETAVCNLASINAARHMKDGQIDREKLKATVTVMMRALDNVIDLNFYPSTRSKESNLKHRPVGLGIMGETEAKIAAGIAFDSEESVNFSDNLMELISYYAISASCDLAVKRGSYSTFQGSKWQRGILPIHTARQPASTILGMEAWDALATKVATKGMRNSNTMAIAPTATISVIVYTTPCIEPIFELSREEQNMSGKFMVVDPCVRYNRPDLLRTAHAIDQSWVIRCGGRRQKWVDQAQSLNIFVRSNIRGSELSDIYLLAWKEGLKSTYYLRPQSNTKAVASDVKTAVAARSNFEEIVESPKFCSIDNPNCESCQ